MVVVETEIKSTCNFGSFTTKVMRKVKKKAKQKIVETFWSGRVLGPTQLKFMRGKRDNRSQLRLVIEMDAGKKGPKSPFWGQHWRPRLAPIADCCRGRTAKVIAGPGIYSP